MIVLVSLITLCIGFVTGFVVARESTEGREYDRALREAYHDGYLKGLSRSARF